MTCHPVLVPVGLFYEHPVVLGQLISRPRRELTLTGELNLTFTDPGVPHLQGDGTPMPKSKTSKRRIDKYAGRAPQIFENGYSVTLGGAHEVAHHYRRHFHQFLDYLTIDPDAQNPLDQVGDGEPALRDAMRRAGIAGLTLDELLKKRDD